MKKLWKRFGILLMAALLLACFVNLPSQAANDKPYTYKVRFFSGQQGTFDGGQQVLEYEITNPEKQIVNFYQDLVTLKNGSKYYVKGIRESGKDNKTVDESSFKVDRDMDYVVAYGISGKLVAYTVEYVDVNGNELAESSTYYGNVGDKPVVAFLYIDGYEPRTYNLTRTLKENAADNIFRFVYRRIGNSQTNETVTSSRTQGGTRRSTVEVVPGTGGNTTTTGGGNGNGGGANGNGNGNGAGGAGNGALADGENEEGVELEDPQVPLDTIDLDTMTEDGVYIEEPVVPLADRTFQLGPIEMDARRLIITLIVIASVAVIGGVSFWYWRPYRKKEKDDEKDGARSL